MNPNLFRRRASENGAELPTAAGHESGPRDTGAVMILIGLAAFFLLCAVVGTGAGVAVWCFCLVTGVRL